MKNKLFIIALAGAFCINLSAMSIAEETQRAEKLYKDYLYYGGTSLTPEEIQKYLVAPQAEALRKAEADVSYKTELINSNPRFDQERKQQLLQEMRDYINNEQAYISQLENDPRAAIKRAETILGQGMVYGLSRGNEYEVADLTKQLAREDWFKKIVDEGDASKIKETLQKYADRWSDVDAPFSSTYGSKEQSSRKDKHNRYIALELLKRLKANPDGTIRYLREAPTKPLPM